MVLQRKTIVGQRYKKFFTLLKVVTAAENYIEKAIHMTDMKSIW